MGYLGHNGNEVKTLATDRHECVQPGVNDQKSFGNGCEAAAGVNRERPLQVSGCDQETFAV
jgi:hypothetical protein